MTSQRKPSPLPQIKAGDIISLPDMGPSTLALVMMDDYQKGDFKGIYYLPIQLMERKSYRGKNVDGEVYHLSGNNHDEIRKATKRGEYRLSEKHICRLDYNITHLAFDEARLPEVFFIKYASAGQTKFFQQTMREFNRILLAKEGLIDTIQEAHYKSLPRMKSPSAREMMKSSVATVKDISLKDAMDLELMHEPYLNEITHQTLQGIGQKKWRPETLRQAFDLVKRMDVDDAAKGAFAKSFEKNAAGSDWTRAEMVEDIKAGWMAFMEQVSNPKEYNFDDIKTDYPVPGR